MRAAACSSARVLTTPARISAAGASAARGGSKVARASGNAVRQRRLRGSSSARSARAATSSGGGKRKRFAVNLVRLRRHTHAFACGVRLLLHRLPSRSVFALGSWIIARLPGSRLNISSPAASASSGPRAARTGDARQASHQSGTRGQRREDPRPWWSAAQRVDNAGESRPLARCYRPPLALRLRRQARGTTNSVPHAQNTKLERRRRAQGGANRFYGRISPRFHVMRRAPPLRERRKRCAVRGAQGAIAGAAVELLLHYCFTTASLLLHYCFTTAAELLLHYCIGTALVLLHYCFTTASLLRRASYCYGEGGVKSLRYGEPRSMAHTAVPRSCIISSSWQSRSNSHLSSWLGRDSLDRRTCLVAFVVRR